MKTKTIKEQCDSCGETRNDGNQESADVEIISKLKKDGKAVLNNHVKVVVPQSLESTVEARAAEVTKIFGHCFLHKTMTLEVNCDDETAEEKINALTDFIASLGHTGHIEIVINGKKYFV